MGLPAAMQFNGMTNSNNGILSYGNWNDRYGIHLGNVCVGQVYTQTL